MRQWEKLKSFGKKWTPHVTCSTTLPTTLLKTQITTGKGQPPTLHTTSKAPYDTQQCIFSNEALDIPMPPHQQINATASSLAVHMLLQTFVWDKGCPP